MASYKFGDLEGVQEGANFKDRKALREAGVHLAPMAGIDGNPTDGASSIVLNGGYVDDEDLGDEIIYTGHGGNDLATKRQINDQDWDDTGNKALIVSEMKGLPVRVTRGYKHKSQFSPIEGYEYGGLYSVTDHFEQQGKDGFIICRYRLAKIAPLTLAQKDKKSQLPEGTDTSKRVSTTILRIVRDTKLTRKIKELYGYKCQVCDMVILVRGVPYAEAAHIKALGKPHDGDDKPGNIICLCPNHHVMFDKGAFSIKDDLRLTGLKGMLKMIEEHRLDPENLKYHRDHVFING